VDWIHLAEDRDKWRTLNGQSGFIKFGGFLDCVSDYQLLKKVSAPWSYLVTVLFYVKLLVSVSLVC
jgi:hypothetical protein